MTIRSLPLAKTLSLSLLKPECNSISMDYTRWTEMQHNPPQNPNQPSTDPYSHHLYTDYTTVYPSYYSHHHPQNPNPHLPIDPYKPHEPHYGIGVDTGLRPPGIDPYSSVSSFPHSHGGGYEAQPGVSYAHHQTVDAGTVAVPFAYYQDPSAIAAAQNWAVNEVARQYGANTYASGVTIPPNGTEQLVPTHPNSTSWTNAITQPRRNGTWKRGPKKTMIVQSAWCEVCKVECNTKDVLDQHKLGKKHKKNLEKLKEAIAPPAGASAESYNPAIGPQENPDKGKAVGGQKTKKAAEPVEDLETKRRKILEGGAAADAVRTCAVCNVVCNSETVFKYHLVGQKHAAMMKKYAPGTGLATAT